MGGVKRPKISSIKKTKSKPVKRVVKKVRKDPLITNSKNKMPYAGFEAFAIYVKNKRFLKGISAQDMAARVGIANTTYSRFESHSLYYVFGDEMLHRICDELEIPYIICELLCRPDSELSTAITSVSKKMSNNDFLYILNNSLIG